MGQKSSYWDLRQETHQLLAKAGFPEEGKKVLRAMTDHISSLTRENRQLRNENTELRALNESLRKLMKNVEGQLNRWRNSYMRQEKK